MDLDKKRKDELYVIKEMIQIYCHKKHGHKHDLCEECQELLDYAAMRIDKCPFMEEKTFCNNCRVHCYKPDMRQRVKDVMRFSGPRMLFVKPHLVVLHEYHSIRHKIKERRKAKSK